MHDCTAAAAVQQSYEKTMSSAYLSRRVNEVQRLEWTNSEISSSYQRYILLFQQSASAEAWSSRWQQKTVRVTDGNWPSLVVGIAYCRVEWLFSFARRCPLAGIVWIWYPQTVKIARFLKIISPILWPRFLQNLRILSKPVL